MERILFLIVAAVTLIWFLAARRRVDLFSLAAGSALIYFLPGFIGHALMLPTPSRPYKLPTPLVDETYVVLALVLAAITAGSILFDRFATRPSGARTVALAADKGIVYVALALAATLLAAAIAMNPELITASDKRFVMESMGRTYTTFAAAATVATVTSFVIGAYRLTALGVALLLVDLYIGFRFSLAIALLSIALIYLWRKGPGRPIQRFWRPLLVILFAGQFFFLYQNIKLPLKQGDFAEVQRRLTDPVWHINNVISSEPFITQSILNEVIRTDFEAPSDHVTDAIYHLIVMAPDLGAEQHTFNGYFQTQLFYNVESGVASNMWAQFWSLGGVAAVIVAVTVFVALLWAASYALFRTRGVAQGLVVLLGTALAFYVQRNEISSLLIIEKRLVIVSTFCVLCAWAALYAAQVIAKSQPAAGGSR